MIYLVFMTIFLFSNLGFLVAYIKIFYKSFKYEFNNAINEKQISAIIAVIFVYLVISILSIAFLPIVKGLVEYDIYSNDLKTYYNKNKKNIESEIKKMVTDEVSKYT